MEKEEWVERWNFRFNTHRCICNLLIKKIMRAHEGKRNIFPFPTFMFNVVKERKKENMLKK
jgi:hypothetical protein